MMSSAVVRDGFERGVQAIGGDPPAQTDQKLGPLHLAAG
jgi:hypothetical protein